MIAIFMQMTQRHIQVANQRLKKRPNCKNEGNNAKNWGIEIKMNIRYDKTTCMLLGTRYKAQNLEPINIQIDGNKIKSVS